MKKYVSILAFLSCQFSAICQSIDSESSPNMFNNIMNELYEDSVFSARILSYAEEIEKHPTYNDSLLIGKFPLVLSKAGDDWFAKFAELKDRVKFYKNLNDTIKDPLAYYENEIKNMDYDSIAVFIHNEDNLIMYGKVYEGFLREYYKFLYKGEEVRAISLSFWGGKQFYSWQDEPRSGISYRIRITNDGALDYKNVETIDPKAGKR
jgi:hypothetical protein